MVSMIGSPGKRPAAPLYVLIIFMVLCLLFHDSESPAQEMAHDGDNTLADESIEDITGEKGWRFKLTGMYKDLFSYQHVDDYFGTGFISQGEKGLAANLKRLRLSPELSWGTMLLAHIDYDNEIVVSSYTGSREFDARWRSSEYNDFMNLAWEPHYSRDLYYRTKIHRAYARLNADDFSFTAGRQQIRFGSGRLWNPLDILNPLSPVFIEDAGEQKGTDALRGDWYFADSSELTFIINPVLTKDHYGDMRIQDSNYVTRVKTSILQTDVAVLGGWISHRAVAGIDCASVLFDGMLRGSILYSNPEKGPYYFQANTGYEYTFGNGLSVLVEYFFNQNGMNFNADLKNAYFSSLIQGINGDTYYLLSNQFITANRHYAGLLLGYDFHPLVHDDLFIIFDFEGRGYFLSQSLTINLMENMDFSLGVLSGHAFGNSQYDSDFDIFDNWNYIYFFSLSIYF